MRAWSPPAPRVAAARPRFGLVLLFEPDVALDLEPAQFHQQRLFGGEQLLGLGLKRAQPLGGAALGVLGGEPRRGREQTRDGHNHEGAKARRHEGRKDLNRQSAICNLQSAMNCYHPQRAGAWHRLRSAAGGAGGQRRDGPAGAAAEDAGPQRACGSDAALVEAVLVAVAEVSGDDEPLGAIVVGLPRRLDGSPNDQTPKVEAFVARLAGRTSLPVVLQDERLTSVEAESRLAVKEKDWRRRKQMLDAAVGRRDPPGLPRRAPSCRPSPIPIVPDPMRRLILLLVALAATGGRRGRLLLRARRRTLPGVRGHRAVRGDHARHGQPRHRARAGGGRRGPRRADVPHGGLPHRHGARVEGRRVPLCRPRLAQGSRPEAGARRRLPAPGDLSRKG